MADLATPAFVARIRARRQGESIEEAVRRLLHTRLAAAVMDEIGSWPSSEPELRELQRLWR